MWSMRGSYLRYVFMAMFVLALAACGRAGSQTEEPVQPTMEDEMSAEATQSEMEATEETQDPDEEVAELTLSFQGLGELGPDAAYEGWLIVDGQPISTGTFSVDSEGMLGDDRFEVAAEDLRAASAFVLTIEPVPDDDPAPSATKYLGGTFEGDSADLDVSFQAALGDDFSMAAGSYVLAVPSADDEGRYARGIWWLDPAAGSGPSLSLPELPDGWAYEGWVVGMGTPHSTGRFTSVSGPDSDGAGSAAGPLDTPPFPGQDFVDPESTLLGYQAVISVEPEPDNSPEPFALKPLVDDEITDVGAEVLQQMSNVAETFPTGSASR